MKLPDRAFPNELLNYGRNYQIIDKITIKDNQLTDNYFQENGELSHWQIGSRNKTPILVNPNDCEWLSQTFFRNENTLYGFTLLEKSNSIKMYLTPIKGKVDFSSFEPLGKNFARDQNRHYYGPGAKIINESQLTLFFDETYKKIGPTEQQLQQSKTHLSLWNTKIATSGEKVYWNGRLAKGVHSSLKRITVWHFKDDYNVYTYDLQKIKKIEGVDIDSLIYLNFFKKSNSINSLICDKHKPLYCYTLDKETDTEFNFKTYKPLFDKYRHTLTSDYWWFKLEKTFTTKP